MAQVTRRINTKTERREENQSISKPQYRSYRTKENYTSKDKCCSDFSNVHKGENSNRERSDSLQKECENEIASIKTDKFAQCCKIFAKALELKQHKVSYSKYIY